MEASVHFSWLREFTSMNLHRRSEEVNAQVGMESILSSNTTVFRYIGSLGLNFLGVGLQGVVIPWQLLELTRSPTSVGGLVILRGIIAVMISPHAGSLSDRRDRRSIAVFANLANGAAVIIFGGTLLFFSLSVPLLYFVTLVMSVANAYFLPASTAHIQSLTNMKFYTRLVSSREIAMQVGVIGGTVAGGPILRLFPFSVTFAVIGSCFVASALSFMWLPSAKAATCANHPYSGLLGNLHNMKEIFSVGHLSIVIALLMVPTLAMQIDNVLISGYVMQELQQNVLSFSMINASYSIGALLAGVTTAQFAKQWLTNIAIPLSLTGMGLAHLLFGLSWCLEVAFVAAFLIGITLVPARIMLNSELMTAAGNEFAGRTQAALQMATSLVMIVIGTVAGASAEEFGYVTGFAFILLICILAAGLYLWKARTEQAV